MSAAGFQPEPSQTYIRRRKRWYPPFGAKPRRGSRTFRCLTNRRRSKRYWCASDSRWGRAYGRAVRG